MYNAGQYNQFQYNGSAQVGGASVSDNIVFNGYSLQNSGILPRDLIDNMPVRDFQTQNIPRNDGQFILGDFWRRKQVIVRGVIVKSTGSLLLAELDAMKKACSQLEGDLDVKVDGVVRRFKATLVNGDQIFSQRQHYHITYMPFELVFETVEPFGKSVDYVSDTFLSKTDLTFNESVSNNGTARSQLVAILNVLSATSITGITLTNNTRGESLVLAEDIEAGDYVRFDSEEMEVTINGADQDYSGGFPLLDPGLNLVTVEITGSSIEYDLTFKHKTTWL